MRWGLIVRAVLAATTALAGLAAAVSWWQAAGLYRNGPVNAQVTWSVLALIALVTLLLSGGLAYEAWALWRRPPGRP